MADDSKVTVYFAVAANLVIAVAKLIAGLLSHSAAMLAEAAHSAADTLNEMFMLVSFARSRKRPDATHPFGYGKERYFWAFMAAVFLFLSGASFSIAKGIYDLAMPSEQRRGDILASYIVLGVAFVSEGVSFWRAHRQLRRDSRRARMRFSEFVRDGKDPTVKVVFFEDAAAVIGLIIAAAGLTMTRLTGNSSFDAIASICIGVLLALVAIAVGVDAKSLLLGEAALPKDRERIYEILAAHEGVEHVIHVLTMATGPESLLVAARVHLSPELTVERVEQLANDIDLRLREAIPAISQFFLDPTSHSERTPPTR